MLTTIDTTHRPQYHFLPPKNWMNDPNGIIQWEGRYHLFYQYNPFGSLWGNITWGHAVSDDLVHWEHLPHALSPAVEDRDSYGVFSGCTINNNGVPTVFYTGTEPAPLQQMPYTQHTNIATSQNGLVTWQKHSGNPIIEAPEACNLIGFRDPSVWRQDGVWYQIIGAGVADVGPTAFLYRSHDLYEWASLGSIYQHQGVHFGDEFVGSMWECPQLLDFGRKQALILGVSHDDTPLHSSYLIGRFENEQFTPEAAYRLDFGDRNFYASQSTVDDKGRTLMWGWMPEARSDELCTAAGWSGIMSLPRVVTLLPNNKLGFAPAPELRKLRRQHERFTGLNLDELVYVRGNALEIELVLRPSMNRIGIQLLCSNDGSEHTDIFYDHRDGILGIDRSHSVIANRSNHVLTTLQNSYRVADGEPLHLHIFLDNSAIEVFANGEACVTGRVYPSCADSLGVRLMAKPYELERMDVWQMASIW